MYKNFQKSTNNISAKYSFLASFCIVAFLFTLIANVAYGITVHNIGGEIIEPIALALDSNDENVYVISGSEIKKINIRNNVTTSAAVDLSNPLRLAVDISDNVYVIDSNTTDHNINKVDKDGRNTQLSLSNCGIYNPYDIDLDGAGNIYILDLEKNEKINKLNSDGMLIKSFNSSNDVNSINEIAVDSVGMIYVNGITNNDNNIIDKLDSDGNYISTIFTGTGNGGVQIAVDRSNKVYISDHDEENMKNIIYRLNTNGEKEVYASYESGNYIYAMAVGKYGDIYVTENNCVKKITVPPELKIDAPNPPIGTVGTPYSYAFTSTGGIGTKTYAVTDGSLPVGLTLSEEGILSGTPTAMGSSRFTITVKDVEAEESSSAVVSLVVSDIPTYTFTYSASDGGYISGQTTQQIKSGGNGSSVTAIPNSGYIFMGWDDGGSTATRTETNVSGYKNVKAIFFKPTVTPPAPPLPPTQVTLPYTPTTGSSSSSSSSPSLNPTQIL